MKFNTITIAIALASLLTLPQTLQAAEGGSNVSTSTGTKIEDPYSGEQSNSPWTQSMENVTTYGGRVVRGAAAMADGNNANGFSSYTPYFPDKTTIVGGTATSKASVGCDGINLGSVIEGQLNQYGQMVEELIQQAPTLAIMYLAYSQPTVKAVIDELNGVSQFGLDLTNLSCSGVRAIADKAAEEKAQAMAEARCTAEAGFKDPECMSDDGLMSNLTKVMKDTKKTVSERSGQYLGKVSSATGGLVSFTGVGSSSGSSGAGGAGSGASTPPKNGVRTKSCDKVKSDGLRTMILASSGIPCDDLLNYGPLIPDYQISDDGSSGVIPRTLTIRKLASDLVVSYEGWINDVMGADEADFINTDSYKAIYNRTGVGISTMQHRKINQFMKTKPSVGLTMMRNMAQLIALKDLTNIVNKLEISVLTGIQNQPDEELLSDLRKRQFVHSVDTLKTELSSLVEEINADLKRNEIIKES
ncbi:hypothetical protein ACI77O_12040 [Pseudomonas tritici]|uniref:hypothetical protein n=1 Tax=Pseudomonas tritici TaxID=2745518 RepID=UPI00387A8986